jgi:hypothetical protein
VTVLASTLPIVHNSVLNGQAVDVQRRISMRWN